MNKQRNVFQTKEQTKTVETDLNEMEKVIYLIEFKYQSQRYAYKAQGNNA